MKNRWLFAMLLFFSGCSDQDASFLDNLSALKREFIDEVLEGSMDECPFHLDYKLRTVFYSEQVVSLFGELHHYTHLPHGWTKYGGAHFL